MYDIDIVLLKKICLSIHIELLLIYIMYDIDIVLLIKNMSLSIHIELLLIYIMYDIDIVLYVLIHSYNCYDNV